MLILERTTPEAHVSPAPKPVRSTVIPGARRPSRTAASRAIGIDALEVRVAKLEKEVASLKKPKAPARRQAPRKPTP